jgi:two-component system chemotaxis response regulator CheY
MNPSMPLPAAIALVVEDDALLRELLVRLLKRKNFIVHEAKDGVEALNIIAREPVDVILTDYLMPQMDGGELVRKIKKDHPSFPVVLVTGEAPDSLILGFLGQSRMVTIIKPFNTECLLSAVEKVLSDDQIARSSTRVSIQVPCRVQIPGSDLKDGQLGTLLDISFTGALLEVPGLVASELSEVQFWFQGLERFTIRAKVRRVLPAQKERATCVGISFEEPQVETQLFLQKFVLSKMKHLGVGIA